MTASPLPALRKPGHRSPTTIPDVVREAGVAIATVSVILNDRADCHASDDTRRRRRGKEPPVRHTDEKFPGADL